MYSDVWSLVEMKQWSVQHHTAAVVELSKQSLLQLHSVVSHSTFKDVMLWLRYCGMVGTEMASRRISEGE